MSLSPNEKYPGATAADPNYKAGKFKDNNPSTINNGSPLKAIDRNERLALEEAIMTDAGFEYNGTVDTPENSQMFKAYKASLSNGANLLSNHNFTDQSPNDSLPLPDGTARNYPAGYEIFSGVFANETTGITNLTYSNGLVSFTAGDFYIPVANTGGVERLTEFVASVADFDGKPRQLDSSSWALIGNEYRVTVGVADLAGGPLGSVKFEQGSVATSHRVLSRSERYIESLMNRKWYSVTDQRTSGVTYSNDRDYPITVTVTAVTTSTVDDYALIRGFVGGLEINQSAATSRGSNIATSITFEVPPNTDYYFVITSGDKKFVREYR